MPDYSQGKIYKLINNDTQQVYYGSTCTTLEKRLKGHKNSYNSWKHSPDKVKHTRSFDLFENNGEVEIELVENYPTDSKQKLEKRERVYIDANDCVNKNRPTRSREEWKENNREGILEYHKKYNEENKEKIYEQLSKEVKCKCGATVKMYNLSKHKKTHKHMKNIDKEQRNKEYWNAHKAKINKRRSAEIRCDTCNMTLNKSSLTRHNNSNYHKLMEKLLSLENSEEKRHAIDEFRKNT
mgnify:CR=1 FL=1